MFGDQGLGQFFRGQQFGMDAHHQQLFIIGAVEYSNFSPLRNDFVLAPEEVMVQLFIAGGLESVHITALGIYAAHDVLDGAVFTGGIHALKNQQQRPAVLGIELLLHLAERGTTFLEQRFGVFFGFDAVGVAGIEILHAKFAAIGDAISPA